MDDLGGVIAKRIVELEKERADLLEDANRKIFALNVTIGELRSLLEPPKAEAPEEPAA